MEFLVVRYAQDHKLSTRQRIIETAGRRLKNDGIVGSGVAALMKDAGLTNGAFYAHFESKNDLVAATIADQLGIQRQVLAQAPHGALGIEQFVRSYLSVGHRESPGEGCPSAALLAEVGRSAEVIKREYTDGLLGIVDEVAIRLWPQDPSSIRAQILGILGSMIGVMQVSRALADPALADAILEQGIQVALTALRNVQPSQPLSS
jgi:TetR/AcrR family transcriptional regulator, transcriptional repressor for nem operon